MDLFPRDHGRDARATLSNCTTTGWILCAYFSS